MCGPLWLMQCSWLALYFISMSYLVAHRYGLSISQNVTREGAEARCPSGHHFRVLAAICEILNGLL